MQSRTRKSASKFTNVEVPPRYKSLTNFTYSIRYPDGRTQDEWPEKPIEVDTFLRLARGKGWKVLALRIEDGDEVVDFYNVLNLPEPHTPEWYRLQKF